MITKKSLLQLELMRLYILEYMHHAPRFFKRINNLNTQVLKREKRRLK